MSRTVAQACPKPLFKRIYVGKPISAAYVKCLVANNAH
jgi:hypothetical protein